ncbi:hypothetical protein LRS13_11145 [Svornostia abyssi]|uniref:Uncharacterized protein n=1 Tax=Svornostia abyssi TaxID=2898438 RepID=A0ABY5PMW7_9ACTN|nr:hypothetical protein LRS13_11145 [Parviterribacteraceae bacterium J379]
MPDDLTAYNEPLSASGRASWLVFPRVAAILLAWVAAFIAFLVAPVLVLVVAWLIGLAILAVRHRGGHAQTPLDQAPAPETYRFGAGASGDGAP